VTEEDVRRDYDVLVEDPTEQHIDPPKKNLNTMKPGDVYYEPMSVEDLLELGEYQLVMEIFMHLVGSSQLQKPASNKRKDGDGGDELTVTDEREDEEKNSESPSGTTLTH
jgi:hypothetical protein